jgi:hypothetical protein
MYKISIAFLVLFSVYIGQTTAQELNATVVVNGTAVQNTVDLKVFKALENSLKDFLNKRKWTTDEFGTNEKIDCQFNITITAKKDDDLYEAKLNVQASRPVYGSDYLSPLINYVDKDFLFKYVQFQPIDFNENRIAGNDAQSANLTAVVAFYVYYILGLDYDSYKLKGGSDHFAKALAIVNGAPEGSGVSGWKNEGTKNRYWLVDNILNSRFRDVREIYYNYHRNGMDALAKTPALATDVILNTIPMLYQVNTDNPNNAIILMYFSTKNNEYYNILEQSDSPEKGNFITQISQLDVANAVRYNALKK